MTMVMGGRGLTVEESVELHGTERESIWKKKEEEEEENHVRRQAENYIYKGKENNATTKRKCRGG